MLYHSAPSADVTLGVARQPTGLAPTLPASSAPLPPPSVAPSAPATPASDPLAGMVAQVQALKSQALATQQTLRALRQHDNEGAWTLARPQWDLAQIGTATALVASMAAVWWYLWWRPQKALRSAVRLPTDASKAHPVAAAARQQPVPAQPSAARPPAGVATADSTGAARSSTPQAKPPAAPAPAPAASADWAPSSHLMPMESVTESPHESGSSVFARAQPLFGFDPAAAADEVQRVRHSLARKREARNQLQLDGDASPGAFLPSAPAGADDRPDTAQAPLEASDSGDIDFSLPDPSSMPMSDLEPTDSGTVEPTPNLGITLALALESEALELWQEARELAQEVLDGGDTEQMIQAQTLINRLDARENP